MNLQRFFDGPGKFLHEERLALYLVVLQIIVLWQQTAQQVHEMTAVQLAHQNPVKAGEDLRGVLRQRTDVIEMGEGNGFTALTHLLHSRKDVAVGSTPANHQKASFRRSIDFEMRDDPCHAGNFFRPLPDHNFVIHRV